MLFCYRTAFVCDVFFFFQAEDGIRDYKVTGVQTCALPISLEFISANESYLWLFDAATGQRTLLTPKGGAEPVSYGGGRFSRDRKGLYVTTDRDAEFHQLAYLDLATKKHTALTGHITWGVEDFDLSRDGKWLAFVTNEDGVSMLHVLETATGQERPVPKLPVDVIGGLQWHANNSE